MCILLDLPDELLVQVFSWIHPSKVFKFRRLSKRMDALLSSKHFAHRDLIQAFGQPGQASTILQHSDITSFFFFAPLAVQNAFAGGYGHMYDEMKLRTKVHRSYALPPSISHFKNLVRLNITGLCGSIPSEIGSLSHLQELIITDSPSLTPAPFPEAIGNIGGLVRLGMSFCNLTGPFPRAVCRLANLEFMSLCHNNLYGPVPSAIESLVNLRTFGVQCNELSGSIPEELGDLVNLKCLYLGGNKFSGNIPASLGNLEDLETLVAYDNQLEGFVPIEFQNLVNLQECDLSGNSDLSCEFDFSVLEI
ncbi:L domain-like protein [Rhizoclosmatium globosum]|uniref:L domain-like protein n=1 Tax=Rhizoclosmatium globosum TaxID=329046 RepID=A0A1Y2CDW5_9FUNG|nr:L domain-like protein [Rhizoclosmatium globosum]|eukprot:ORY45116.1 L domain-like protein [Rhizoclosmatium globosum]